MQTAVNGCSATRQELRRGSLGRDRLERIGTADVGEMVGSAWPGSGRRTSLRRLRLPENSMDAKSGSLHEQTERERYEKEQKGEEGREGKGGTVVLEHQARGTGKEKKESREGGRQRNLLVGWSSGELLLKSTTTTRPAEAWVGVEEEGAAREGG